MHPRSPAWRLRAFILALALLAAGRPGLLAEAPANIRGMHTLAARSFEEIDQQLDWTAGLVGPGGYVKQYFTPVDETTDGPTPEAIHFVEQAYARDLDPIVRLQGAFRNARACDYGQLEAWVAPRPDGDDYARLAYTAEAAGFRRFVEGLPRVDQHALYVEIWNEPNLDQSWGGAASATEYARFFVDTSAAIHAIGDDRIRVLNAGLAPEGDLDNFQFIADAIAVEPGFVTAFDAWASHPYPHNQPPERNLHDGTALPGSRYTIDAYLLELDVLRRNGVDTPNLRVFLTETGYPLGNAWYPAYPTVNEENRARYMKRALEEFWPRWPEVAAVTPFALSDPDGSWEPLDWVRPTSESDDNGLPTEARLQYARLVPGLGLVRGRVRDQAGNPVKGATIATNVGGHRATSLADGSYLLLARPGTYTVDAVKTSYSSSAAQPVTVGGGDGPSLDFSLTEQLPTALQNPSFESGDLRGWTTWDVVGGVESGPWFFDIAPADQDRFFGSASMCGEKDGGLYQSLAAPPGRTVEASAFVLTRSEGAYPIGSRVGLDPAGGSDPDGPAVVWSPWTETGGEWRRIAVAATTREGRVTVFLEHQQHPSNRWSVNAFDGVELGER